MDIVERVVRLNDAISQVESQASALRHDIMRVGTGLAVPACDSSPQRDDGPQRDGPQLDGPVRRHTARMLKTDLLPPEILNDPRFWDVVATDDADPRGPVDSPAYLRPDMPVKADPWRYRC